MLSLTDRIFYHIYPLGFCGAPRNNDFISPAGNGLKRIIDFIPHLVDLGINALYIGPLFESSGHGYDTLDYYWTDRRLGTNEDLKLLIRELHKKNIIVVLDAVFNHTGRHFFAFGDIQKNGRSSPYRDWYAGIDFEKRSPLNDNFSYTGWSGNYDLVKLNTSNPAVREHLFGAVKHWVDTFDIDGLRLDAAAELDIGFLKSLSEYSKKLKNDFWLMGEIVTDKYDNYAFDGCLDSATNYVLYKGLWSSFNDKNFFELAYTLNRQYGENGKYKNIALYNFADNHDVDRLASVLVNKKHLNELYALYFTLPGIPSIYYGSEYGALGKRTKLSDSDLRPAWTELEADKDKKQKYFDHEIDSGILYSVIKKYIAMRKNKPVLRNGSFRQIYVSGEQYVFMREIAGGNSGPVLTAINSSGKEAILKIRIENTGNYQNTKWHDIAAGGESFVYSNGLNIKLNPFSIKILEKAP